MASQSTARVVPYDDFLEDVPPGTKTVTPSGHELELLPDGVVLMNGTTRFSVADGDSPMHLRGPRRNQVN